MSHFGSKGRITVGMALVTAVAMTVMALAFTGGSTASATGHAGAGATGSTFTKIAHNPQGYAKSKIVGETAKGQRVTGYFTPMGFSKKNGHLRTRGLISGVIHKGDGTTRTFSAVRTLRVKSMNGTVPGAARTAASAKATCDILNLVLAPLDLNLLGLQVHLDRVVLNIVAVSGAGQLLGNLLCAVANLLNGGGLLSQLLTNLNAILNQLLLGL
jgi:hypothetical protein